MLSKVTTRFMNGKILIFAKVSLASSVYDFIDVLCFPNEHVRGIFSKNDIVKCLIYLILTDADSTSLFLYSYAK